MKIEKRCGKSEELSLDKISKRIRASANNSPRLCSVDVGLLTQKVVSMIYDDIKTQEIDELSAKLSISMSTDHPDYGTLASRIIISNLHKKTRKTVKVLDLYSGLFAAGYTGEKFTENILSFDYDSILQFSRDNLFDYFGYKTLEKAYLKPGERPQHLFLRVAVQIHGQDFEKVKETYDLMSNKFFTHASPTLFNSGITKPQLSSCFLLDGGVDSIEGIYKNLADCARISKWGGGIGIHIHDIRAKNSKILGTNGQSDGIVPMLKVYNATARYVNQSGKRKGSIAIYLEPWHADIIDFLDLKKNHGSEEHRARDLFYAMWIPNHFMKCVESDDDWYLMSSNESPGLSDAINSDFVELYNSYIARGLYRRKLKARDVWKAIINSQIETGTPYMLYKDECNSRSNQKNLGTIKSSNLCAEIVEYSSPDETAVCNLGSVCLPSFAKKKSFDYAKLAKCVGVLVRNLDKIIDENYYPINEGKTSNSRNRPIGVGVQGLADLFLEFGLPFSSLEAKKINSKVFQHIYYSAIEASMEISRENGGIEGGGCYSTFVGSPFSEGKFQFDLAGRDFELDPDLDWEKLRENVVKHGMRNSLLTAVMPTASTSQIMGFSECIEPYQTNIFTRSTLSGEFPVVNKYLIRDLIKLELWTPKVRNEIIRNSGSIQDISLIPNPVKEKYKTAWELSQKTLIELSADRGLFIDQSQSLNLFMAEPTFKKITSMHFYGWQSGLKTGQYYLRTKPAVQAIKITVDNEEPKEPKEQPKEQPKECTDEVCYSCSG